MMQGKGKERKIEQGALQGFLRGVSRAGLGEDVGYGDQIGSNVERLGFSRGCKKSDLKGSFWGIVLRGSLQTFEIIGKLSFPLVPSTCAISAVSL